MSALTCPAPHRRSTPTGTIRGAFVAAVAGLIGLGGTVAEAGWSPAAEQTFDLQLTQPFNLVRPVNVLALDLFTTPPAKVGELRGRGVAPFCYVAAGYWESWRPDAGNFPAAALGATVAGWPSQRRIDIGNPAVRPILEARLALCKERGFTGVLVAGLDTLAHGAGFATTGEQRLAFQRDLAAAAHARGLAAGAIGSFAGPAELDAAWDFVVADGCQPERACAEALAPWRSAGKPAYLVAYTNQATKMDRLCSEAAEHGLQVIFKTQSLNGKLHRRCS